MPYIIHKNFCIRVNKYFMILNIYICNVFQSQVILRNVKDIIYELVLFKSYLSKSIHDLREYDCIAINTCVIFKAEI